MPSPRAEAAATRFGKYELVEPIGKGGMAEVWKARMVGPAGFSRVVVVKRVLPHLAEDPELAQMFLAEARLSARLEHPNIVQVYELGEEGGHYFLAMEYVRGRNLGELVRAFSRSGGAPPPGAAVVVVRDICRALAYAHNVTDDDGAPLMLVHRDVTPSNIMVTYEGAAKLLDFGIAKALGAAGGRRTQTGALKGKFAYLAPEQVDARGQIDHRTDLFAAGVVLWEALTGGRLFKGESDVQTLALVREAVVTPPSRHNPAVPPSLDAVCMKALARDPDERFGDGEEMAEALDGCARQVGWRHDGLKTLMRDLFPEDTAARAPSLAVPAAPAAGDPEAPPTTISRSRVPTPRRWRRVEVVAATAALAVTAFVAWSLLHARPAAQATPATTAATMPAAPPAATPAAPPTVSVTVTSTPPGAALFVDDEPAPRGHTPATLVLPRSSQPHRLTLALPGHPPKVIPVRADADSHVELALVPATPPAAPHPLRHVPPPRHKPAPPHDVLHGAVVDPFK